MTVVLASLATLVGGLLAGLSLDRSLVALPAWRRLDVEAWAVFSRHADLGRGLVLYPVLGVGGPLLSVATAFAYVVETGRPCGEHSGDPGGGAVVGSSARHGPRGAGHAPGW